MAEELAQARPVGVGHAADKRLVEVRGGRFVEVEGPDESSVMKVREKLGLASRPIVKSSYIALLMSYLQERGRATKTVTFEDAAPAAKG